MGENIYICNHKESIPRSIINIIGKYLLASNHAGAIRGYNPSTDAVIITNPWVSAAEIEIPLFDGLCK